MGDPDEARAARDARSDSEQRDALHETLRALVQSDMMVARIPVLHWISKSGFLCIPTKGFDPILECQNHNCLHFALLDYRACGEKNMLGWAEAYIKEPAFFILFLSFRPFVRREGNMKRQHLARFKTVLGRFQDRCSVSLLDDNVICLSSHTLEVKGREHNADLISNEDGFEGAQHLLNLVVKAVQDLRDSIFKEEPKRCGCFGQVVKSKDQSFVALALIGYAKEDTGRLRDALAAMVVGRLKNVNLVTASVNGQGASHFSWGTFSLKPQGHGNMGDAWQGERPVDYIMNIGQPFWGLRKRVASQEYHLKWADEGSSSFCQDKGCKGKPAAPSQTWAKADFQLTRKAIYDSAEMAWSSIVQELFSRDQEATTKLVSQMRAEIFRASVEKQNALAALARKSTRDGVRPALQHVRQVVPNDGVGQTGSETEDHNQKKGKNNQSKRRRAAKHRQAEAARRALEQNDPPIPLDLCGDDRFARGEFEYPVSFTLQKSSTSTTLPESGMPETGKKTRPNFEESDRCTQVVQLAGELQAGLWQACLKKPPKVNVAIEQLNRP